MPSCLYVTSSVRSEGGGDWPQCPGLLTALRTRFDVTTAYAVVEGQPPHDRIGFNDEIAYTAGLPPLDLVVVESRLFDGTEPRIPLPWLRHLVRSGAQLLLHGFQQQGDFNVGEELIPAVLKEAEDGSGGLVGYDDLAGVDGDPRFLWCELESMFGVANYLRPAYGGFRGVGVVSALLITPLGDICATADKSRARKLSRGDQFQDDDHIVIWAAVRVYGRGHVWLSSGDMCSAYTLEHCPENVPWMMSLIETLQRHSHFILPHTENTTGTLNDLPEAPLESLQALLGHNDAAAVHERLQEAGRCFEGGAFLACVIMLGSALEAALVRKVSGDLEDASKSQFAPRVKDGRVKQPDHWTLAVLISVARDRGWLHAANADFSDVLRDYRNYVHSLAGEGRPAIDEHAARVCWFVATSAMRDLAACHKVEPS